MPTTSTLAESTRGSLEAGRCAGKARLGVRALLLPVFGMLLACNDGVQDGDSSDTEGASDAIADSGTAPDDRDAAAADIDDPDLGDANGADDAADVGPALDASVDVRVDVTDTEGPLDGSTTDELGDTQGETSDDAHADEGVTDVGSDGDRDEEDGDDATGEDAADTTDVDEADVDAGGGSTGACAHTSDCGLPGATASCEAGVCVIAACAAGRASCDGRDETGCEVDLLASASHCGACDAPCDGPCEDGRCRGPQPMTFYVTTTAMTVDVAGATRIPQDLRQASSLYVPDSFHARHLPGDDGLVSLREAILAASYTPGGPHTIVLEEGATYTLTEADNGWYGPTGLPPILGAMVIEGRGATIERSAAPDTPPFRIFVVMGPWHTGGPNKVALPSGHLTLRDLTLRGGLAQGGHGGVGFHFASPVLLVRGGAGGGLGAGGAIFNQGELILDRVALVDHRARGGDGGGLQTVTDNSPTHSTGGGGMGGSGVQTLISYANNVPAGGFAGNSFLAAEGHVAMAGVARVEGHSALGGNGGVGTGGGGGGFGPGDNGESDPSGRGSNGGGDGVPVGAAAREPASGGGFGGGGRASGGGGGVGGGGAGSHGWTPGGQGGFGGGGGGGSAHAFAPAFRCQNVHPGGLGGFGGGGAGGARCGSDDAIVESATSGGYGGGGGGNPIPSVAGGGGGGAGMGGAVFNHGGSVIVRNSTLANNAAVGGNAARGVPGSGLGGAIFSMNGNVLLEHATLWANEVADGTGLGLPQFRAAGGALFLLRSCGPGVGRCPAAPQTATVRASIVGGSTGGDDVFADGLSQDEFATDDASIIRSGWWGRGTPRLVDPLLSDLADNGGGTSTFLPRPGSPAVDAVACSPEIAIDQRGASRPDAGSTSATPCDLGAVEVGGATE